jgi:hypothetical protein
MPFPSSSSAAKSWTRSGAAPSRTCSACAGRRTSPSTGSAGHCTLRPRNLTDRERARLKAPSKPRTRPSRSPSPGRPTSGWAATGRTRHRHVPDLPDPEVARLRRTLPPGKSRYWPTSTPEPAGRVSNGGTEAIDLITERTRRLAQGFRDFNHYRLRILLAVDGTRPYLFDEGVVEDAVHGDGADEEDQTHPRAQPPSASSTTELPPLVGILSGA